MQVQSVQATNNCHKPCFKAYFEANRHLKGLWEDARKTQELYKQIKKLTSQNKNHKLEIINCESGWQDGHFGNSYKVLNHYTNYMSEYFIVSENLRKKDFENYRKKNLFFILKCVNEDKNLFKEEPLSEADKMFRLLTKYKLTEQ